MRNVFGLIALFAVVFTACTDNQFKGFEKSDSGLYYKFYVQGDDTIRAHDGDLVSMYINYRTLNDSLFNTNSTNEPIGVHMRKSDYQGDVYEGIRMMSVGDSATFVVSTDSFFTKVYNAEIPDYLDSGSYFFIDIKIEDILDKEAQAQKAYNDMLELQKKEKALIDEYLKNNNLVIPPDSNGIFKTTTKSGYGKSVVAGNYAKINLRFNLLDRPQPIFDSWVNSNGKGIDIVVGTGYFGVGLDNCLLSAKVGDVFTAVIPSEQAFGARGVERLVPPYSALHYECEVISTDTEEAYRAKKMKQEEEDKRKQEKELNSYLKKNNINSTPDNDGIYKKTEVEGTGAMPVAGDRVSVHYTGYFLDGTKFDSSVDRNQPFEFAIATGSVIPGWDKALSTMKVGEKSIFVIPSELAYGPQGKNSIPPNTILVFEIELLSIGVNN